jgi:hypothetical protein
METSGGWASHGDIWGGGGGWETSRGWANHLFAGNKQSDNCGILRT